MEASPSAPLCQSISREATVIVRNFRARDGWQTDSRISPWGFSQKDSGNLGVCIQGEQESDAAIAA